MQPRSLDILFLCTQSNFCLHFNLSFMSLALLVLCFFFPHMFNIQSSRLRLHPGMEPGPRRLHFCAHALPKLLGGPEGVGGHPGHGDCSAYAWGQPVGQRVRVTAPCVVDDRKPAVEGLMVHCTLCVLFFSYYSWFKRVHCTECVRVQCSTAAPCASECSKCQPHQDKSLSTLHHWVESHQ